MFNRMIFVYGAIVCFFGFLLVWIVQYFWKAHNRSAFDYHTPAKLGQNVGEEKRKHPRVDINWRVSMETSDGIVVGEAKNISLGGAFICCKEPLRLREVFRLTMIGPDNEPVMATAEVAWSNVNVPKEKVVNRGMGVRFINMSDRHIQLVRQICQSSD